MYSRILYKKEARKELVAGVNKLVDAVKVTLGGSGKNVAILDKTSHPHITKDGVTVAKSILLRNDVQQGGVEIVRQAAIQAANETGDGTTTSTVIAGSLIKQGMDLIDTENIQQLNDGMNHAYQMISQKLDEISVNNYTEEDIVNIATISANGDRVIGELVGRSIFDLGADNTYTVEYVNDTSGLSFEKRTGYRYEKTMTMHFENLLGTGKTELEKPKVLLLNCHLGDKTQLADLTHYSLVNNQPVVILYKTIDPAVLEFLVTVYNNKKLKVVAVEIPDFGELQELSAKDFEVCTGAKRIMNLNNYKIDVENDLGNIDSFSIDGNEIKIVFTEEKQPAVRELCETLKKSYEEASDANVYLFKERYLRTSTGSGVFKIGFATITETQEVKDRVDDAIGSVKSAMKEGYVPGGGLALLKCANELKHLSFYNKSFQKGYDIVINACREPFRNIILNCGVPEKSKKWMFKKQTEDLEYILDKVIKSNYKLGYNAREKKLDNFIEKGIIDATRVAKVSLQSAISATVGILTTECVIFPEDNKLEVAID